MLQKTVERYSTKEGQTKMPYILYNDAKIYGLVITPD